MTRTLHVMMVTLLLLVCATVRPLSAQGQAEPAGDLIVPVREKALEISEKNKDALIIVQFVVTINVKLGAQQGQPSDQRLQARGVVIRKDGLVAVANSQTDPTAAVTRQLKARAGNQEVEVTTAVKEVKIILNDGKEIEAEVAIKDGDIDLTLVRPKAPLEKELPAVALDPQASPEPLDPVLALTRMGLDAGRAVLIIRDTVRGIVQEPRKHFILQPGDIGVPVFDGEGRCFGMYLGRASATGEASGNIFVLPARDILELVKQVQ